MQGDHNFSVAPVDIMYLYLFLWCFYQIWVYMRMGFFQFYLIFRYQFIRFVKNFVLDRFNKKDIV